MFYFFYSENIKISSIAITTLFQSYKNISYNIPLKYAVWTFRLWRYLKDTETFATFSSQNITQCFSNG